MKLHVSDGISVHHQQSSTVNTAVCICHIGYADCLLAIRQHNICVLLCVQRYTADGGQRYCPKHVEFYSKNKVEKLVQFVGIVIRINSFAKVRIGAQIFTLYSVLYPRATLLNLFQLTEH